MYDSLLARLLDALSSLARRDPKSRYDWYDGYYSPSD